MFTHFKALPNQITIDPGMLSDMHNLAVYHLKDCVAYQTSSLSSPWHKERETNSLAHTAVHHNELPSGIIKCWCCDQNAYKQSCIREQKENSSLSMAVENIELVHDRALTQQQHCLLPAVPIEQKGTARVIRKKRWETSSWEESRWKEVNSERNKVAAGPRRAI